MKRISFCSYWLLPVMVAILFGCNPSHHRPEGGKLTLEDFDHEFAQPHTLDGEWELYPGLLLDPAAFATDTLPEPLLVKVPAPWGSYQLADGSPFPTDNSATFRLVIQLGQKTDELGLFIPKIWQSNKVFANGQLISQKGHVSYDQTLISQDIIYNLVTLPPLTENGELELIVQVSSYGFFLGGLVESFWLGSYKGLRIKQDLSNTWAVMWIGCLLLMSIYHVVLYIFRRENVSLLYFGILCLLTGVRLMVFGDHFFYTLIKEDLDILRPDWQVKIYYFSIVLTVLFFFFYLKSIYPSIFKWTWPIKLMRTLVVVFILLTAPASVAYALIIVNLSVILAVPLGLMSLYILVVAAIQRREESTLQVIGILAVLLGALNDTLHGQGIEIIGEIEFTPVAFGGFMFIQFIVLAKRYSDALKNSEDLNINLEKKVEKRTEELAKSRDEISDKSAALEKAYQSITDSVRYARRIQSSLMGTQKSVQSYFHDSFIIFHPKDIVSGDFYWYGEADCYTNDQGERIEDCRKLKIMVAADCTGHGVPGAFMTLIGHNALDEIIHEQGIHNPSQILVELDKRVIKVFHDKEGEKRNEGMDMAILMIDSTNHRIYYAGAKNPLWWKRKGDDQMRVIKASKAPIGGLQIKDKKFETHVVAYESYDKFYIFSDGFQDQFGGQDDRKYMTKRFRKFLFDHSDLPMVEQQALLQKELVSWKGENQQTDDILVMGICVGERAQL